MLSSLHATSTFGFQGSGSGMEGVLPKVWLLNGLSGILCVEAVNPSSALALRKLLYLVLS